MSDNDAKHGVRSEPSVHGGCGPDPGSARES